MRSTMTLAAIALAAAMLASPATAQSTSRIHNYLQNLKREIITPAIRGRRINVPAAVAAVRG